MESEFDELTEAGFRRWVVTNFYPPSEVKELKEQVQTQFKETKNLKKRLYDILTRITSIEKNINNLIELKNIAQELHEAYTRINSQINQVKERISEIDDQLNEIK